MSTPYCQLEGLLSFSSNDSFLQAVTLLQQHKLISGNSLIHPKTGEPLFAYAINPDLNVIVLPPLHNCDLLELRHELFDLIAPQQTHFKALVIEEDAQIIVWNDHTHELVELAGSEIADLFIHEDDKRFFEYDYHQIEDDMSEEAFYMRRSALAKQAFEKIDGVLEMQAINDYLSQLAQD